MTLRWRQWLMFCAIFSLNIAPVRANLNLANFSPSHPVKIMAIGDSITDDCEANGAWRLYLQTLLDTNGFPFTFIGRNSSSPSGSFTKTLHEGYCGAVIAPPGVLGNSVHGYVGTNVYLQTIVPDALAANTPDLVLVLIGANDIGRGRDPFQVATNDLPQLLDIILTRVPNAQVILTKITSLQGANTGGLNYGAFATNVYPYNANVQAMVNQRRALGQNVSLADMFSVVDPNTMFNTDHLHPNAMGLQAIAQEFYTRIQAITTTTNSPVTTTLIHGGDTWKYNDTGTDLGTNWSQTSFDDSTWSNGIARLGYGDFSIVTTIGFGGNTTNRNITTYFRHPFVAPANLSLTNLQFRLERVDGAVVWLNGQEIYRTNMTAVTGPVAYTNLALRTSIADNAYIFFPTNFPATNLLAGTNIIGVEVHLKSANRTDMGFDFELLGSGNYVAPPALAISLNNSVTQLTWPVTSVPFTLYSSTNPVAPASWLKSPISSQTNGAQINATVPASPITQFFRLQQF